MNTSYEDSFSGRVALFFGAITLIAVTIISFAMVQFAYLAFALFFVVFYIVVKIIWNGIGWLAKGRGYDASDGRSFGFVMWFLYVAGCIAFTFSVAADMPGSP